MSYNEFRNIKLLCVSQCVVHSSQPGTRCIKASLHCSAPAPASPSARCTRGGLQDAADFGRQYCTWYEFWADVCSIRREMRAKLYRQKPCRFVSCIACARIPTLGVSYHCVNWLFPRSLGNPVHRTTQLDPTWSGKQCPRSEGNGRVCMPRWSITRKICTEPEISFEQEHLCLLVLELQYSVLSDEPRSISGTELSLRTFVDRGSRPPSLT